MKRWILCGALVLGMAGQAAKAELLFYSGNELLEMCRDKNIVDPVRCTGYISGVADALSSPYVARYRVCRPKEVTVGQVRDIAVAWLEANPSKRHYAAITLVALALSEAFPCKK